MVTRMAKMKNHTRQRADEDVKKCKPSCIVGENAKYCSYFEKQ